MADLRQLASLSVTLDFELLFQEAPTDWCGAVEGHGTMHVQSNAVRTVDACGTWCMVSRGTSCARTILDESTVLVSSAAVR